MSFQENLIHYREKAGYKSAKDFARKLGINYTTYMGYENKNREPKYSLLVKIAGLLSVSIDTLLGYDPKQPNELEKAVNFLKEGGVRFAPVSPSGTVSIYVFDYLEGLCPDGLREAMKNTPVVFPTEKVIEFYDLVEGEISFRNRLMLSDIIEKVLKNMILDDLINSGYANGLFNKEIPKEGIEIHSKPKK